MKLRPLALIAVMVLSLTACGRAASQPSEAPVTVTSGCLAEAPTPSPEATPAATADMTAPPAPSAAPTPSAAPASGMEPPLLAFLNDQPVPEFLDVEQRELFLHAYSAANFLMGCSTSSVDNFPNWDGSELDAETRNSYELVEVPGALSEGWRYDTAVGRYARWDDFKAMMDGLFTAEYQEKELLNSTAWDDGVTVYPVFTSTEDGRLCYLEADRGSDIEYDYCDTPDSYELVSQSEDEIVFNLVGHYAHLGYDPATHMPVPQDEYTRSYPIRMELTGAGWRFSEFHLPY